MTRETELRIKRENNLVEKCLLIDKKQEYSIRRIGSQLRIRIYDRDNNKCLRCGSKENLTIDHIVPVSMGGVKEKFNLQTLCKHCNQWKGSRIIDFRHKPTKKRTE